MILTRINLLEYILLMCPPFRNEPIPSVSTMSTSKQNIMAITNNVDDLIGHPVQEKELIT